MRTRATSVSATRISAMPFMFGSPYAIFLLREYFRSIPRDLINAARLDGAGVLQRLVWIEAPLALPSVIAGIRADRAGEDEQLAHDVQREAVGERAGGGQVAVGPGAGVGAPLEGGGQQGGPGALTPGVRDDEGLERAVGQRGRVAEQAVAVRDEEVVAGPGESEEEGLAERLDPVGGGHGRRSGPHLLDLLGSQLDEGGGRPGHETSPPVSVSSSPRSGTKR